MKNKVQDGAVITFTADAAYSGGAGIMRGRIFGVVCGDVASGDDGEMDTQGVFDLTKAAVAITDKDLMYWDATNKVVTNVASGNYLIGSAVQDNADTDATARVRLRDAEDEHTGKVGAAVADLTENAGAVGGTNDGNLPDLTTPDASSNAAAVREVANKFNALLAELRVAGVIASS